MRIPILPFIRACRPLHAAKNLLLFLPLLAGHYGKGTQWVDAFMAAAAK